MRLSVPVPPPTWRPDAAFDLACATAWLPPPALEEAHFARVRALSERIVDWPSYAALLDRHQTSVLAHASLSRSGATVPPAVVTSLAAGARSARLRALHQMAETSRLVDRLAASGIEAIPLKGPALSQQLYGDATMRVSVDLDVMVRPERFREADDLVLSSGYERFYPAAVLTERQWRTMSRVPIEFVYFPRGAGAPLELHRDACWIPGSVDAYWNSRTLVAWQDRSIATLRPDMLLLYLCEHGGSHKWSRLKWLGDIARLLSQPDVVDVASTIALADSLALRRPLAQGALLAQWLFGVDLSPPLAELVASERVVGWLARRALREMQERKVDVLPRSLLWVLEHDSYLLALMPELSLRMFWAHRWFTLRRRTWKLLAPLHA